QGERVNTFWGMLGELVFGGYLYQYNVPNVYNNPIYQEKVGMKQYDFLIPHFGTVEVKGIGPEPNKRNLLVKVSEWKKSEYVVAVKFDSEEHGRLAGWLTGREAENLPS